MKRSKPFPFQRKGIRLLHKKFKGRGLLADEMGLGKTVQSLFFAKWHLKPGPVIIVCPAHLKEQWKREAANHVGIGATILSGQTPYYNHPIRKPRFYIINYEILAYWVRWLRKLKPVAVFGDEIHRIKDLTAQCTMAFIRLCKNVKKIVLMTGTPIENDHADLFPSLHILRPDKFKSFFAYAWKFCRPRMIRGRWIYKGARNGRLLRKLLLKYCMIRRRKKDVLKDLPDKIVSVVPLTLHKSARAEYDEAERDIIKWLEKTKPEKTNKARRNQARAKFHYLKRLAVDLTMKQRKEWLKYFGQESNDKLLAFGWHVDVLKEFHEGFKNSVLIIGETSIRKRQLRVDKFNRDTKTRTLFGNLQAAGTGWNCTSSSSVAFLELGLKPSQHNQAIDRVHGLGRGRKGRKVNVYFLVAQNTIEEDICSILQTKQEISDRVIDGKRGRKVEDDSMYDLLERRLLKKRR